MKSNIFTSFYIQYSSEITLNIKGIGYYDKFGSIISSHFDNINNLNELYINGEKQDLTDDKYYFNKTYNFVKLIWDDNITNCRNMFSRCENISEIDLSNFNSSQVRDMSYMFEGCSSLISLDLSNFDTSKVRDMYRMFEGCSSLILLDLSNFDTSQIRFMDYMFYGCSSLISLNLSNFNTSQVRYMDYIFSGSVNLEYINLSNFNESNLIFPDSKYQNIFYNVPENIVICVKERITKYKILSQITEKKCYTIDCSSDWKSKQKLLNNATNKCIENSEKPKMSKEEEIEYYDDLLKMIEESFTDNYNTSKLDNGEDEIIKTEKMTVTFTTTENQKKNKNNNMSTIDLGDCEYLLKNKYNISINETLYMKKIDIVQEEMTTTKVEYDVYCKLSGTNLIKLPHFI